MRMKRPRKSKTDMTDSTKYYSTGIFREISYFIAYHWVILGTAVFRDGLALSCHLKRSKRFNQKLINLHESRPAERLE